MNGVFFFSHQVAWLWSLSWAWWCRRIISRCQQGDICVLPLEDDIQILKYVCVCILFFLWFYITSHSVCFRIWRTGEICMINIDESTSTLTCHMFDLGPSTWEPRHHVYSHMLRSFQIHQCDYSILQPVMCLHFFGCAFKRFDALYRIIYCHVGYVDLWGMFSSPFRTNQTNSCCFAGQDGMFGEPPLTYMSKNGWWGEPVQFFVQHINNCQ